MTEAKKLIEVPIAYLWSGLVLTDDVYNPEGTVLLIPRGEVITQKKLEQLTHFGSADQCVATYEDSYHIIMNGENVPKEARQERIEREFGYTNLRERVEHVLKISQCAASVERTVVETVITDMVSKLQEKELTAIFNCIHVPRPIDEQLQRHLLNVGFLNGMMGQWLQLSGEEVRSLVLIGLLHDIGKTKIPKEILDVPRKLTPEEYEQVKLHSVYSWELLGSQFSEPMKAAILHHHERVDGSGYPDGLKGEEIPLFSKITAISDVYDAMVSERCYKEAVCPLEILDRVRMAEFEGLDPILVSLFVKNMVRYYRNKQVRMSDGTQGEIVYIPPNDISHPVVHIGEDIRQTDEEWYCSQVIRQSRIG